MWLGDWAGGGGRGRSKEWLEEKEQCAHQLPPLQEYDRQILATLTKQYVGLKCLALVPFYVYLGVEVVVAVEGGVGAKVEVELVIAVEGVVGAKVEV